VDGLGGSVCVRRAHLYAPTLRCRTSVPVSYSCGTPDEERRKMLIGSCLCDILSDQLYTWSDQHTYGTCRCSSQTPHRPFASTTAPSVDLAWLSNRAIQAMWQARMQMCRWSWAWPQVLSVGELSRPSSADGLRAPRGLWASFGVSHQLSSDPRDSGRDLRDQPGVTSSSRGTLKRCYERMVINPTWSDRCGGWRRASGQYAGRLARREPGEFIFCGGRR
jgi:hypothetical protein